jgi:hypothetical protein
MTLYKQLSLREKATLFTDLIREPGWDLLQSSFRPELRTRVTDTDAKEAFLYEAIRAQVIQEIFSTPLLTIQQAEREWSRKQPETD